jgi:transglutaminase-like putative cysteine protease
MEHIEQYLMPTSVIDSDSRLIRETANELIKDQEDIADKAKSLFHFVRDQIKFSMYVNIELAENYKASTTLQRREGYCVMKAVLLTALARAAGIPARLAFADLTNHMLPQKYIEMQGNNSIIYHGFTELYLNGKWVKATPAFDLDMCERYGIISTDFDGETDAMLHSVDKRGAPHVEYIKFHGSFADLPHAEILEATKRGYGQDFLEVWKESAQRTFETTGTDSD